MIKLLDKAGEYLDTYREAEASTGYKKTNLTTLDNYDTQLTTTRYLLVNIRDDDRYKTDRVRSGLPDVAEKLETLVRDLREGKPLSTRKLHNDIQDLEGKTKRLRSLLPGIYIDSEGNRAEGTSEWQNNGVIAELDKDQLGGLTSISKNNYSSSGVQNNSFIQGKDPDAIRKDTGGTSAKRH